MRLAWLASAEVMSVFCHSISDRHMMISSFGQQSSDVPSERARDEQVIQVGQASRRSVLRSLTVLGLAPRWNALVYTSMNKQDRLTDSAVILLDAAEQDIARAHMRSAAGYLADLERRHLKKLIFGDATLSRRYLKALALVHNAGGQVEAAVGAYDQLQILSRRANRPSDYAEAILGKVVTLTSNDRARVAEALLREHASELGTVGDPAIDIEYAYWKARVIAEVGDYKSALDTMLHGVLPIARANADPGLLVAFHSTTSRIALKCSMRDWRVAETSLHHATNLLGPDVNIQRRAQLATARANFLLTCGDLEGADEELRHAEDLYEIAGVHSPHPAAVKQALVAKTS